ncbi:MAG: Zn-ribbon domain-containing OB-fold protein [Acidimicrobiia bacterium]
MPRVNDAPVVGFVGPSHDRPDAPFWAGLGAGELRMPRCPECDRWRWPPEWICPECHSEQLHWEAVPATGRVYSWTRTWHAFVPELAGHVPYVVVLVELPDAGGCRLLGLLVDDGARGARCPRRDSEVRIGDPVVGVIQSPGPATGSVAVLRWRRAEPA